MSARNANPAAPAWLGAAMRESVTDYRRFWGEFSRPPWSWRCSRCEQARFVLRWEPARTTNGRRQDPALRWFHYCPQAHNRRELVPPAELVVQTVLSHGGPSLPATSAGALVGRDWLLERGLVPTWQAILLLFDLHGIPLTKTRLARDTLPTLLPPPGPQLLLIDAPASGAPSERGARAGQRARRAVHIESRAIEERPGGGRRVVITEETHQ
jgi:hypothetical protein